MSLPFPTPHLKRSSKLPLLPFDFQISFRSFHHKDILFLDAPPLFQISPTTILRQNDLLPQPTLVGLKTPDPLPQQGHIKKSNINNA